MHDGTAQHIISSDVKKHEVFIAYASAVLKGLENIWLGVYLQNWMLLILVTKHKALSHLTHLVNKKVFQIPSP